MSIFERRQNAPQLPPVVAGEREDLGCLESCQSDQPVDSPSHLGDLPPPPVRGAFNLSPRGGGAVEEAAALLPALLPALLHSDEPAAELRRSPTALGGEIEPGEERERGAARKERASKKSSRRTSKRFSQRLITPRLSVFPSLCINKTNTITVTNKHG